MLFPTSFAWIIECDLKMEINPTVIRSMIQPVKYSIEMDAY